MGFGSYDESEQREVEADFSEDKLEGDRAPHDGELEFENGATSDELIDRLSDIKDEN